MKQQRINDALQQHSLTEHFWPTNEIVTLPQHPAAGPDGEVDYGQLDRPTVIRNKVAGERYATGTDGSMDYLDIPAFLRRQAD